MRYTYSIIFVFLLGAITFAQDAVRIRYILDYKLDSMNVDNSNRELMILDYVPNENKSYFRPEALYKKDSVASSSNPMALLGMGIKRPKFRYAIEKDHKLHKLVSYEDYSAYKFSVEDEVSLQWDIKNEVKNILGHNCQMATTQFRGRDYIAWFASELPFSDGPYKFKGLPGVILELYDTKKHYHFQAFQIMKLSDYKSYIDINQFKQISKKDFKKFLSNVREKPSMMLNTQGITISGDALEKFDKNNRERSKKENNFIEIED